ncbi:MAG: 3-isopropylmalate dehydratase [Candidatus Omnitrophota bacterium]
MKLKGRVLRLGDNINTDFIISGRYKFSITDIKELSRHIMEDIDPEFSKKILPGETILVCGKNFGMGSSREQAPLVIKESGIIAVVAVSFARIFYRNGFNIGLPLIEADTDKIKEGNILEVDFNKGVLNDLSQDIQLSITPLPKIMQTLLNAAGVVNYYKKYKRLPLVFR